MYPHVRQLERRPLELERNREPSIKGRHRTGPPRYKLALLTWPWLAPAGDGSRPGR
jgi:hypothetical protein